MKSLKETYDEWRWLTYNQLDKTLITLMSTGEYPINVGEKYSDNIYYKNYTEENLRRYMEGDFSVSNNLIKNYDRLIHSKAKEMVEKHSSYFFGQFHFLRSKFIENCLIYIASVDRDEL